MTTTVGVDIGGTKILGVALDRQDPKRALTEVRVPTPDREETLLDEIAEVVLKLNGPDVAAVGVGVAGLVDRSGILRTSPNIPALQHVDVTTELRRRLDGLPVHVDNDAMCAAWAEHAIGAARDAPDAVCLAIGTGIGAGMIADNRPHRGAHGFGGEVGHMVVDPTGPACPCGRRGCWEQFASGPGLARLGREAAAAGRLERALSFAGGQVDLLTGKHVSRAALEGDRQALEVMDTFARWIAVGIGNLVAVLDCSFFVVAGGLVDLGDLLLDPVRDALQSQLMSPEERSDVCIVPAQLGERAGAIGAALLGVHQLDL